jgi:hypothetical protein
MRKVNITSGQHEAHGHSGLLGLGPAWQVHERPLGQPTPLGHDQSTHGTVSPGVATTSAPTMHGELSNAQLMTKGQRLKRGNGPWTTAY